MDLSIIVPTFNEGPNVVELLRRIGDTLDAIIRSPARRYRSPEDVSRLAQFYDRAIWTDTVALPEHFVSY